MTDADLIPEHGSQKCASHTSSARPTGTDDSKAALAYPRSLDQTRQDAARLPARPRSTVAWTSAQFYTRTLLHRNDFFGAAFLPAGGRTYSAVSNPALSEPPRHENAYIRLGGERDGALVGRQHRDVLLPPCGRCRLAERNAWWLQCARVV